MTEQEEIALVLAEMRLEGVEPCIVNFFKRYMNVSRGSVHYVAIHHARKWMASYRMASYKWWIDAFGHHFVDANNLPTDEEWRRQRRGDTDAQA